MIVCIVGDFGVGKDTFADMMLKYLPESQKILSYTTRPPRFPTEETHIFKTFDAISQYFIDDVHLEVPNDWVAYTIIDKNVYWTQKDQFDKPFNIYVIDDVGLEQVLNANIDDVYVIHITRPRDKILLNVSEDRINRQTMKERFDYKDNIDFQFCNDGTLGELEEAAKMASQLVMDVYFPKFFRSDIPI